MFLITLCPKLANRTGNRFITEVLKPSLKKLTGENASVPPMAIDHIWKFPPAEIIDGKRRAAMFRVFEKLLAKIPASVSPNWVCALF